MAIKLKNSRNIGRMIIILVLAICSAGMMLTYWWTSDELDEYVPARADTESILIPIPKRLLLQLAVVPLVSPVPVLR